MKKINKIQIPSFTQWRAVWSAYWHLWPFILQIKFKQFFNDTGWITKNITFVQNEPLDRSAIHGSQNNAGDVAQLELARQLELAKQLHESVRLAARLHFLPVHCLPRSIVLANLLKVRNIEAQVYIGVSKNENDFASHAWLEVCGQMVAEPEAVGHNFTRLNS